MRTTIWIAAVALSLGATSLPAQDRGSQLPPDQFPDAAAVDEARAMVRTTFAEEYRATKSAARKELAQTLIRKASDSANGSAIQCAMLLEAGTIGATAGDMDSVSLVGCELDARYSSESLPARLSLLAAATRTIASADGVRALAEEYFALADTAAWAGEFRVAELAAGTGVDLSSRSRDVALKTLGQAKGALFHDLAAAEAGHGDGDRAILRRTLFRCAVKDDWTGGLADLAVAGPDSVKQLAKKDIAASSPAESLAMGDAWLMSAKADGDTQSPIYRYAYALRPTHWYESAASGCAGLSHDYACSRLKETKSLLAWESEEAATQELKAALTGSDWTWETGEPNVVMVFNNDGSVSHRGMRAAWEATGPRCVRLRLENGDTMTFAFDRALTHYVSLGRGFGGNRVLK